MTAKDYEVLKYFKTVKCVKCTFENGKTEMKSLYDAGNLAILGTSVSGLIDTDCEDINKLKMNGRFPSDKELSTSEDDDFDRLDELSESLTKDFDDLEKRLDEDFDELDKLLDQ